VLGARVFALGLRQSLNISPHLKCVATLPCEILMLENYNNTSVHCATHDQFPRTGNTCIHFSWHLAIKIARLLIPWTIKSLKNIIVQQRVYRSRMHNVTSLSTVDCWRFGTKCSRPSSTLDSAIKVKIHYTSFPVASP